jgi:hypothetical protein
MIHTFSQVLVNTSDRLLSQLQVSRQPVSRHLLVEAFDDLKLAAKLRQRFLSLAALTFNVASSRATDFERTAVDALSAALKVGRTTEMARSYCNHTTLAYDAGYFSP